MTMTILLARAADGSAVTLDHARSGDRYSCWECGRQIVFYASYERNGRAVAAHFAHRGPSDCIAEGAIHLVAKAALAEHLRSHGQLHLEQRCSRLGCQSTRRQQHVLPPHDRVQLERVHGPWRIDVALTHADATVLAVELHSHHPVPEEKSRGLDIPWVEVDAASVLVDPSVLQVSARARLTAAQRRALSRALRSPVRHLETRLGAMTDEEFGALLEQLSPDVVAALFQAWQVSTNLVDDWLCPACQRAQRVWEAEQEHLAAKHRRREAALQRALERQQQRLGRELIRPLSADDLALAETLDGILERLVRWVDLIALVAHWRVAGHERLTLAPCCDCGVPIVQVNTRHVLMRPELYAGLLRNARVWAPGMVRTRAVAACPHCGADQPQEPLEASAAVTGSRLVRWHESVAQR